jgi:hypothetical protein
MKPIGSYWKNNMLSALKMLNKSVKATDHIC